MSGGAVSAGHTEGPWHIHYKADHKDGADLPWIGGHMGKPLAFITHETILKEDLTRANCNARFIVSACNSYKRQCGDRAIEAAEADLLGRCLEALKMAAPLLAEAQEALCGRDDVCVTSDGDDALLPLRDAINFILSQAREAQA